MKKLLTNSLAIFCLLSATNSYASRDDRWPIATPESKGLTTEALDQASDGVKKVSLRYCFSVIKDGELIYDQNYFGGINNSYTAYSVTKTMTALLIGIAQTHGYLSVDDKISDWLSELPSGMNPDATIRDVMGQVSESNPLGSNFSYNSGAVIDSLGQVLSQATGMASEDYAQQQLLDRLDMQYTTWNSDSDGNIKVGLGVRSSCRDLARVGQLMLNQGVWEGQPLLDASFISNMTQPSYPYANSNYGYLTWLNQSNGEWHRPFKSGTDIMLKGAPTNVYFATGLFGQFIVVIPDLHIVITSMGTTLQLESLNTLQKIWNAIAPALDE
ncbi:MAG: serine hydrolase [Thalassolituus sp.]|uniref:serine hydrolase domain-containing protein n=1 Tax=Thalassolituus sp. TaxID=2030822 RepID=UPI003981F347